MKILVEYNETQDELIFVKDATYIGDYAIRIFFSDGYEKLVDFKPFIHASAHSSIRKYLDESKFKDFAITDGNLNWDSYDLIFPLEDLYTGKL